MTREELKSFRTRAREVAQAKESLILMRAAIEPVPCANTVEEYIALEEQYLTMIKAYAEERNRIERAIIDLAPNERSVIRAYYLDGKTWEEVAEQMYYSVQHIRRLHATALDGLKNK